MIFLFEEVLLIHHEIIELTGGSHGIRDINSLESAISRPEQTFDGKELYPDTIAKTAAIGESIIMNHPFIDGNKRTGIILMETILHMNGKLISAPEEKIYDFVIQISTGEIKFEEIVRWLQKNTGKI